MSCLRQTAEVIRIIYLMSTFQGYPLLVTKEKTEDVAHTKSALQKKLTVLF